MKLTLFAIYKDGFHKGNQTGKSPSDAIKKYIKDSMLGAFVNDIEFVKKYSAVLAIKGIHYNEELSKQE